MFVLRDWKCLFACNFYKKKPDWTAFKERSILLYRSKKVWFLFKFRWRSQTGSQTQNTRHSGEGRTTPGTARPCPGPHIYFYPSYKVHCHTAPHHSLKLLSLGLPLTHFPAMASFLWVPKTVQSLTQIAEDCALAESSLRGLTKLEQVVTWFALLTGQIAIVTLSAVR